MTNKKSQSHVEIVLATILFIGFLIFLFIFIKSAPKITKDISTYEVRSAIMKEIEANIGKLSIVLASETSCFDLTELYDEYGTNFRVISDPINKKRITVYYGEFFEKNFQACDSNKKNFKTGTYIEEKIILEQNILKLVNDYNSDYSALKQRLGIENFAFEFKDKTGNLIKTFSVNGKIPQNSNIRLEDFPVRVINNKAEISELALNIKVWN